MLTLAAWLGESLSCKIIQDWRKYSFQIHQIIKSLWYVHQGRTWLVYITEHNIRGVLLVYIDPKLKYISISVSWSCWLSVSTWCLSASAQSSMISWSCIRSCNSVESLVSWPSWLHDILSLLSVFQSPPSSVIPFQTLEHSLKTNQIRSLILLKKYILSFNQIFWLWKKRFKLYRQVPVSAHPSWWLDCWCWLLWLLWQHCGEEMPWSSQCLLLSATLMKISVDQSLDHTSLQQLPPPQQ